MTKAIELLSLALLLLAAVIAHAASPQSVGHELEVHIDPAQGTIRAKDRLTLPKTRTWDFLLHRDLEPHVVAGTGALTHIGTQEHLEHYRLQPSCSASVTLAYEGPIRHQLEDVREGMGRARQSSRGVISPEGVMLSGFSGWYPRDPSALQHLDLHVHLPKGWTAVSQGAGPEVSGTEDGVSIHWREDQPQDDLYLIAAPFERYAKSTPNGEAQVYLRHADQTLAQRYLDATERYLALYSSLIGPYPYAKFALVENFWETGLGMPSFTLLGPRVIRLPFILHTSYPHEVLHNWWGNGVYVDYDTGNWSEGLTAYLADHLLAEQTGRGAEYRRDSLRAYADYVREANDLPLREFRGRHGSASQAVGYGKTLMVLHMLRRDLGDQTFLAALRRFYKEHLFQTAGFDDLRRAMEGVSGRDLEGFFRDWTERTGAPQLALTQVEAKKQTHGHILRGRIAQTQVEDPFPLNVPLVVHLEGGGILEHRIALSKRSADFELQLPAAPLRVDLDPQFDLFRTLASGESPITLSALFGAERGLIILPSSAPSDLAKGYRRLAETWRDGSAGWEIAMDADLDLLPKDRPVWLLGWSNRFLPDLAADPRGFQLDVQRRLLSLPHGDLGGQDASLALVSRRGDQPLGWIASSDPRALPGLARKLPHYGKYSYLIFQGEAPTNRIKGQWSVQDSSLMVWLTGRRHDLTLPPRRPLTTILD